MPRKSKIALKAKVHDYPDLVYPSMEGLERTAGKWREAVFGNLGPLHVELGCGRGAFLLELAPRLPEVNFLALEVKADRCARAGKRYHEAGLTNVRVICGYLQVFWPLLADVECSRFWVNFPDPWPKKRSEKHRMLGRSQLPLLRERLEPGGLIHLRTDAAEFVEWVDTQVEGSGFELTPSPQGDPVWEAAAEVRTDYERRFRAAGKPIHYRHLRRTD